MCLCVRAETYVTQKVQWNVNRCSIICDTRVLTILCAQFSRNRALVTPFSLPLQFICFLLLLFCDTHVRYFIYYFSDVTHLTCWGRGIKFLDSVGIILGLRHILQRAGKVKQGSCFVYKKLQKNERNISFATLVAAADGDWGIFEIKPASDKAPRL